MALTPYGRLRGSSLDERERSVSREAVEYSAYAMVLFGALAWLWSIARGSPSSEYTAMLAVGGASFLIALVVLHRKS